MMGIEKKYDHFVANTPQKILKVLYIGTINKFKKNDIPNLEILINFKNLKILEAQRKRFVDNDIPFYAKAKIKIRSNCLKLIFFQRSTLKKLDIKIKVKYIPIVEIKILVP